MSVKFKTRDVKRTMFTNYLKRAEECYNAAVRSFDNEEWTACAISTIHSGIAACDAMCVYFLGKRNAGENHNNAVTLFKSIKNDESINKNANRSCKLLQSKNIAEYEERLVFKSEADKALKNSKRFLDYVNNEIGKNR